MCVRLLVECQFDVMCIEGVALVFRTLLALHQFDVQRLCLRLLIKIRAFHFRIIDGTLLKTQLTHCRNVNLVSVRCDFFL